MSFFDSVPQAPPPEPVPYARRAYMQPHGVLPGSVPGELLLLRTDEAAVSIGGICAYPNGFEFTTHVRRRGSRAAIAPGLSDPFDRMRQRGPEASGDVLRLGVLYADGRRGATTGGPRLPDDPEQVILMPGGGGGSAQRYDCRFWAHPLPPDGPVIFVAAWPEYAAAEAQAELEGGAIRAAATRAVTLWPEEEFKTPGPSVSSVTFTAVRRSDEPESETEPHPPQH